MDAILAIRQRLEEVRERTESTEFAETVRTGLNDGLRQLSERIDFEAASLYVFSKRKRALQKLSDFGGGVNFIEKVRFENGRGLSAWVAKKQQQIYLPDIHRGSRHGQAPIRSYISIPILYDEEIMGVLNLSHVKPNSFERASLIIIRSFIESVKPILQMYQRHQYGMRLRKDKDFARRR